MQQALKPQGLGPRTGGLARRSMLAAVVAAIVGAVLCWAPDRAGASPLAAAKASVVRVVVVPAIGSGQVTTGSGFKIAPGLYITNHHVIEHASDGAHPIWIIPSQAGSQPVPARVRATIAHDLALLEADDTSAPAMAIDPVIPEAGSSVIALGYPGQMDAVLARNQLGHPEQPDVTIGAIINVGQSQQEDGTALTELIHSANLWPGNSGGPLIDKCGRVVGVNTWLHSADGLAQQNISISAADLLRFLSSNSVTPTVDRRDCNDGVIAAGPAPLTPSAAVAPLHHTVDPPSGMGDLGVLIIGGLLALGVALGAILVVGRREAKRRNMTARGDSW